MRRVLILLMSMVLLLSSCKDRGRGDGINIAISQEPVTLDIMTNSTLMGRIIASGNIYEKLLVLDGDGNIREELAESYSLSDNNRRLTFVIRDDVFFHNGKKMRAEDVASSMNRYLALYSRAKEITGDSSFYVVDGHTIEIVSDTSLLFLPSLIASSPQEAVIMPEEVIDGTSLVTSFIGTGPYMLDSWSPGEKIVLGKFDQYSGYGDESNGRWGKKSAEEEKLTYYFVPDSLTRLLGLESGQYDFINDVMTADFSRIEKNNKLSLLSGDESGSITLVYNKKEGPLSSERVRQAVSYALSSEMLMASCYGMDGLWDTSSNYMECHQKEWSVIDDNPYRERNPDKAEELLNGEDVTKIRVLTSNLSNLDKIALVIKENLEDIGIDVEIIVSDWATFYEERSSSSSWDIFISAYTSVPIPQMKSYLSPSYPGWVEEESVVTETMDALNSASDLEEAESIWQEGQKRIWDYNPVYVAGHYSTVYASSVRLSNIIIQDGFFFWNAEKE